MARQVVVTGCSRGIGRALVEAFQERGIAVAGCARSSNAVAELGPAPRFRPLDVCDGDGLEDWVRDLEADQFEADLVIANAGTLNVRAPFWKVSNKEFSDVVDVNVKGVFQTLKAFTPGMIESWAVSTALRHECVMPLVEYCMQYAAGAGGSQTQNDGHSPFM